jgi:hypothetical protein
MRKKLKEWKENKIKQNKTDTQLEKENLIQSAKKRERDGIYKSNTCGL